MILFKFDRPSGLSRKVGAFVAALTLFTISSCASNPAAGFKTIEDFQNQNLNWQSCYEDFQCAELLVPIDYTNYKVGLFKIALMKYPAQAPKKRLGSLVINPGGPGGSGVDYARGAPYLFDPEVIDSYDIVGFDPRGVGKSAPIHCYTDAETDASYAADSKPDNAEELAITLADAKLFAQKCKEKNKFLLNFSSSETARDMDILRAALGDKKLNFVGKSYGTYIGTLYAQLFPEKVGRMLLDGAINPNISVLEQDITQAIGFETALTAFINDCAKQKDCPLSSDLDTARSELVTLFEKAATEPLKMKDEESNDGRVATESILVLGTASALYENTLGWKELRKAITQAKEGYGNAFLSLADLYGDRGPDGKYSSNQLDAGMVIDCLDWQSSRTPEELQADAVDFKVRAPIFGPYLAYTGLACTYINPKTATTNKISNINTAPVVIVGTLRDPATPYVWAVELHKIFANSVLITLDADGHTGEGRGSSCVDKAAAIYFLRGQIPSSNISCSL